MFNYPIYGESDENKFPRCYVYLHIHIIALHSGAVQQKPIQVQNIPTLFRGLKLRVETGTGITSSEVNTGEK